MNNELRLVAAGGELLPAGDVPTMLDIAAARWQDYLKYIGTTT